MQQKHDHNHSQITHLAGCKVEGCSYKAEVHAHDDDTAARILSEDLAAHNKSAHNIETNPTKITDSVKARMDHLKSN